MSWNYRVVKELAPTDGWSGRRLRNTQDSEPIYSIREVYYDGHDDEKLSWTKGPHGIPPGGVTLTELRDDYQRQATAFTKPVVIIREEAFIGVEAIDGKQEKG